MIARPLVRIVGILTIFALVLLVTPRVVVACSCMAPEPGRSAMDAAAADASISVFTGIAGPQGPDGVPVVLTRWFRGAAPPVAQVMLDPVGFVDPMGGMCGTVAPGLGTEWIFAATRNDTGRFDVHLCTTHAPLDSDVGQTLLADAVAVFGAATVPEPSPAAAPEPEPGSALDGVVPIVLAVLFGGGVVAGAFVVLRRRQDA